MSLPKFSLSDNKYDQSRFIGRVKHFFEVFNPALFLKTQSEINDAKNLLAKYRNGEVINDNPEINKRLWESKTITEATIHPQTGERIPLLFRFSSFVPVNIPIVLGMLTARSTTLQIFWQWLNQSYNVAVNHCNGNKTHPLPPKKIFCAYLSAVSVSCGLVIALGRIVYPLARISPNFGLATRALIPFFSVATAGASNACLMRFNDFINGVEVKDIDGEVRGVSNIAGMKAVHEVCLTRMVIPIPTILFPGIFKAVVDKYRIFRYAPWLSLPVNATFITLILYISLPIAIGMFPQENYISTDQMELGFRNLYLKNGSKVEKLYYNKVLSEQISNALPHEKSHLLAQLCLTRKE